MSKNKKESNGSRIQSLILDKRYYPTAQAAKAKAVKMGFYPGKTEVLANTIRVQQRPSEDFKEFRVMKMTPTVQATIGIKKPR
jgi:hypothetical protein